jgi:hypothetical protein
MRTLLVVLLASLATACAGSRAAEHLDRHDQRQGRARVVEEPSGPHFYWLGEWNYYSLAGALDSVQTYNLGKRQSTRYLTGNRLLPAK